MLTQIQLTSNDSKLTQLIGTYLSKRNKRNLNKLPQSVGTKYNQLLDRLTALVGEYGYLDSGICAYLLREYTNSNSEVRIRMD